jgi:CBS domain-containing protein
MSEDSDSMMGRSAYLLDGHLVTLMDLLDAGLLAPGDELTLARPRAGGIERAVVTETGALALEGGQQFRSPTRAATMAGDPSGHGWRAWTVASSGQSLDSLRQQLLDQAATETTEESSATYWDPQRRYEWLREARTLADAETPIELAVRDLVSRWEVPASFQRIEADLANHGLTTQPDFRKVSPETVVRLITPGSEGESSGSGPDEDGQLDIGLTVGNLPSALNGVVSVSPTATFDEAITLMALNGYSQLPVMSGTHNLRGAVTWQSIAYARHASPDASFADAIIHAREARYDQELIEVLPDLEESDFAFVRDDKNAVAGIITTADVVATYRELSTPFILIGELDQVLRKLIARTFSLNEVCTMCDPDGKRSIDSYDKLEMGDYQRMLENPDHWKKLGWPLDRATFIKRLDDLRLIRNNVMHFNPEPRDPQAVQKLRFMLKLLRDFGGK